MVVQILTAAAVVTGVAECILAELADNPETHGTPGRIVYLTPGQIAWDGCDCGQLAMTIVRRYPTVRFPADDSQNAAQGGCKIRPTAIEAVASLSWCTPGLKANAPYTPTAAELLEAALQFEADAFVMRTAIECCLDSMKRSRLLWDWRVGAAVTAGPDGYCAETHVTFFFQLM